MTKSKMVLGALLFFGHLYTTAHASEEAVAKDFKAKLVALCEDDTHCVKAVEKQFDACLKRSDFKKFVNTSAAQEDRYLASTIDYMYSCVVDEDGEPYFEQREE